MQYAYHASLALSIAAFAFYGARCLLSDGMVAEFERFGLSRFRRLTGALELAGALGLAAGTFVAPLIPAAAAGLAALMLLGVLARLRVGDSLVDTLPALVLLLINLFLVIASVGGRAAAGPA